MALELVTMSTREIDRVDVVRRVLEHSLTKAKAGELVGLSARQVHRLCVRYAQHGPAGLVSLQRGRPSNHRLPDDVRERAVAIVREHYADFGPTLAREKLLDLHDVRVGRETLRKWLAAAGLWTTRRERAARSTSRGIAGTAWASSSRSTDAITNGSSAAAFGARSSSTWTTRLGGSWSSDSCPRSPPSTTSGPRSHT